jgi:hypothetical protein
MIGHQSEALALRIDGGLVMDRPILEMKYEPAGDSIAAGGLYQIAVSQRCSVECPQDQEAMDQPFGVSDGHCLAGQRTGPEQGSTGDQPREQPGSAYRRCLV